MPRGEPEETRRPQHRPIILGVVHGVDWNSPKDSAARALREIDRVQEELSALPPGSLVGIEATKRSLERQSKDINGLAMLKSYPQIRRLVKARLEKAAKRPLAKNQYAIPCEVPTTLSDVLSVSAVLAKRLGHQVVPLDSDPMMRIHAKIGTRMAEPYLEPGFPEWDALVFKTRKLWVLRSFKMARRMLDDKVALAIVGDGHALDVRPVAKDHFTILHSPEIESIRQSERHPPRKLEELRERLRKRLGERLARKRTKG